MPWIEPQLEDRGYETPCLIWKYCLTAGSGYGIFSQDGQTVYVHRLMYKTFVGPIPDKYDVDHLCRNRDCIHPEHLEPVTRAVNVQRGAMSKLTEQDVIDIKNRYTPWDRNNSQRAIARDYGIAKGVVQNIIEGKKWRNANA